MYSWAVLWEGSEVNYALLTPWDLGQIMIAIWVAPHIKWYASMSIGLTWLGYGYWWAFVKMGVPL